MNACAEFAALFAPSHQVFFVLLLSSRAGDKVRNTPLDLWIKEGVVQIMRARCRRVMNEEAGRPY
jgi:hypothetical protein